MAPVAICNACLRSMKSPFVFSSRWRMSERPEPAEETLALGRRGLIGRRHKMLLGIGSRRQTQFGAHRLGRAIIAIEPSVIVADAVATRRSRLDVVARAGDGGANRQAREKHSKKKVTRFHGQPPIPIPFER